MSIYVRPVREQIEHDRVIRHLQSKLKRKFEVAANIGTETAASVKGPNGLCFPDLVLTSADRGRRLAGVIEVETGESVHHLEAMAQWAPFGRLKVPFHLYVPVQSADIAKRLAADLGAHVTELWTYHSVGDQIRLNLVQRSPIPGEARRVADRARAAEKRATAERAKNAKPKPAKTARAAKAKPRTPKPAARKTARKPAPKKAARRPASKRK